MKCSDNSFLEMSDILQNVKFGNICMFYSFCFLHRLVAILMRGSNNDNPPGIDVNTACCVKSPRDANLKKKSSFSLIMTEPFTTGTHISYTLTYNLSFPVESNETFCDFFLNLPSLLSEARNNLLTIFIDMLVVLWQCL